MCFELLFSAFNIVIDPSHSTTVRRRGTAGQVFRLKAYSLKL